MSIHFSQDRWEAVRKNYRAWWDGTLDRPLVKAAVRCHQPGSPGTGCAISGSKQLPRFFDFPRSRG